ncbi:hypothetical protein B0H34DRAFT_805778 [Crassisporium funariophilum]|nr:hypothetical protein B0H34DRAFT_805778 [Crassisporium funariophilum]
MSGGVPGHGLPSRIDSSITRDSYNASEASASTSQARPTALPSTRLSSLPDTDSPFLTTQPRPIPNTSQRARNESRKLLSHVLLQLANRSKPPSILEMVTNVTNDMNEGGFSKIAESLREAVKLGIRHESRPEKRTGTFQDDTEDQINRAFSTDDTLELMMQLKDVLTMSVSQGWEIFGDGPLLREGTSDADSKLASSFRRSRNSFRAGGKRSRSSSPSKGQVQVPELLSLCVSILASVVSEDCRYQVAIPRPSRPPNALQVLTLNIAQFLIHAHRHDPRVISQIAFAMIPAFSTFDSQMHSRLLSFFESSVVRIVLQNLETIQGFPMKRLETQACNDDPFDSISPPNPIVSIQIDEVRLESETSSPRREIPVVSTPISGGIQSTNDPHQSPHIYHLAFIIPPLLSAILDSIENIQDSNQDSEVYSRFDSLLRSIAISKVDSFNDMLEIVAYRNPKSRRLAIASLATLWPKAVGHAIVSSPFTLSTPHPAQYSETFKHPYAHQFVPWHFENRRVHFNHVAHDDCRSCMKPIHDFGLLCPLCMCAVHFDCYDYPEGNYQVQYSMESDTHVRRIAMYRFSDLQSNGEASHSIVSKNDHHFKPVNWFTLCLCHVCQKPLWGCTAQGVKCGGCFMPLHFSCISLLGLAEQCGRLAVTSKQMVISWDLLRDSCLEHFPFLQLPVEQLIKCSREEITIFHAVLRTQLQLLANAINMGSIVINQRGDILAQIEGQKFKTFELHQVFNQCEQLLASKIHPSALTQQYLQDNNGTRAGTSISMYDWSYLEYISASIKVSSAQTQNPPRMASEFLNVNQPVDAGVQASTSTTHAYEVVSLSHMRNILGVDFAIHSDHAALLLLNHLHHLSFFDRADYGIKPFENLSLERSANCIFPLPFGLDFSMNVETLVSSVEACLTDLDLSSNEFGLLLLTRRLWPNTLASDYGLKRLAGRVLFWVLDEDDNLATILREFVAKKRRLPGVQTDRGWLPWPPSHDFRPGAAGVSSNGGDYVAARRSLLSRFAIPWLLELHNLGPSLYGQIVFEACLELAADRGLDPTAFYTRHQVKDGKGSTTRCDNLLRSIVRFCQASVIFSVFDDVFLLWLKTALDLNQSDQHMASLHRLFEYETETLQRASTALDSAPSDGPTPLLLVDPLRAIMNFASQSAENLSLGLSYLTMFIRSGVDIPTSSFTHFSNLIDANSSSCLNDADLLLKAIVLCLWLRSLGRQGLQSIIASLHSRLSSQISKCLVTGREASVALSIIRHSYGACLRLYGCERSSIIKINVVTLTEVQGLPSRRRLTVRGSGVVDPVFVDPEILASLELYLTSNVDEVSCLTSNFLNLFLTESPLLEAFEAENFILRNGRLLALCVWKSYDIQREDTAIVRTNLLLRSLTVDSEPFHDILHSCFSAPSSSLQHRLSGVNRLFRMISDVTSPAFHVEGRQWRSSVIEIFYQYFSALWADPVEEVRLAVRSASAALLPAHFEIISQCWIETLTKAPITDRVKLVGFLIQLRPHFPTWKVLSWDAMLDTLVEFDYDPKYSANHHIRPNDTFLEQERLGHRMSSADPDMAQLRVSILLLSLQMIADGIEIDNFSLLKLKVQFVQIAGFSNISVIPTQSGHSFHLQFGDITVASESAYPCIEELVHVVDAPYFTDLPHSALGRGVDQEDRSSHVLVGSIFIDACLCILSTLRDLTSLPVLTLKCVLEALHIIIHKHDFEDDLFRHFQPLLRRSVLRTIELLSRDISYELRQLALSIAQVSIKRWHSFLGTTISTILELVAAEIASQGQNSQDSLVVHGKLLIGNTFQSFCNSGLLLSLMKRPLKPDFFVVLRQVMSVPAKDNRFVPDSLCDLLVRDTLARAVESDPASFPLVLQNICNFITIVHFQGYSSDLLTFTGQQLTHLVRRMSDGTIEGADASPLILIFVTLIQNNKKRAKDLLPYVDTVLRVALNRLHVEARSLTLLVAATASPHHKTQASAQGVLDVTSVLFEILWDGFRMKTKISPLTIKCLVKVLTTTENPALLPLSVAHETAFRNLVDDALTFLQTHAWHNDNIEDDFQGVMATGRLLLQAATRNPTLLQRFADHTSEKTSTSSLGIRSWNVLLLAALQEQQDDWISSIYAHFSTYSRTHSALLRTYVQSGITSLEAATTDVNQLHVAMKLWLMLAHSFSMLTHGAETQIFKVWNELWSGYEGFLNVLEMEAQVGLYPTLISLASASIADILIYMRSLRTPLVLETATHIAILSRLQKLNRGDSSSSKKRNVILTPATLKIMRAIRSVSDTPPEIPMNILLDQIAKELIAAEKLRVVEAKRENGRVTGDRFRKDARLPTL